MTICTFYQRGTCRFGDQCKNEHPGSQRDANRNTGGGFGGGSNNNRFGGFNNNSGDRYRPNQSNQSNQSSGTFGGNRDPKTLPYHLDKLDMKNDLTGQRPIYPLSCYGPGRDAPRQLIEGPVELSPEELRVRYYNQRSADNEAVAQQEESALNEKMQQQVTAILNDIDGAIRYVEEGAKMHPNRIDIAKGAALSSTTGNAPSGPSASSSNPFSQAPANALSQNANPFKQPPSGPISTFGQVSTPAFGRPAFGQASNPGQTTSTFGQPSNPGLTAPGFGAASSLGPKPSPFSSPALGGGAAFGKPAFGTSGFGQTSMLGAGSALGQSSAPGQKPAFGQASAPGTAVPFGHPSTIGQQPKAFSTPAFGQSGFGQASQLGSSATPFGQTGQSSPSPFGQQPAAQASPFGLQGQQNNQANVFGQGQSQPAAVGANPFAAKPAQGATTIGQPSQPASGALPFGAQQNQTTTPAASNIFGQKPQQPTATPAAPAVFGTQTQPAQAFSLATPNSQQPATSLALQAPSSGPAKDIDPKDRFKEGKPEDYQGEQGRVLEEIYRRVGQLGRFNDDEEIPLIPPKCEWIVPIPLL